MKKKLFSLLSILFLPVLGYSNCSGTPSTWTNGSTDQKWSTITNWNPSTCFPDGTTDSATFIDQANSISLDATITLGKINFTTTIGNITWDFSPNAPGDHFIFTGSASQINVTPTSSFFGITIDGDFVVPIVITNTNTTMSLSAGGTTANRFNIAEIDFDSSFTMTNASLTNTNVLGSGATTFQPNIVTFALTPSLTNATITNSNANPNTDRGLPNNQMTFASDVNLASGNTITNTNSGAINNATLASPPTSGSYMEFTNLTVSGGTINNTNTTGGNISGTPGDPGFGSFITLSNGLSISSGLVFNENSGNVDANSFGALIRITGSTISISGGTLRNNDTVQSPTITTSGTGDLSGIGLYTGVSDTAGPAVTTTVTNGGIVEPFSGTVPGTLTINGTYSQSAGTLQIDLQSDSSSSLLNVLGTASMGGTLNVNFLSGNTVTGTTPFTIVEATTLNAIPFDNITFTNLPLGLTPNPLQYNFGSNGTIILSFSGHVIPPTPPSTLPTTYAGGFIETVLSDINHINSHITIKMEDLRGRFSAQGPAVSRIGRNYISSTNERFLAFNPETEEKEEQLRREVVETEKVNPGSFYFGPTGRAYGEIHSKDGDPGAHYWSVGGLMGADYAFSEVGIGAMADYERIFVHAKDNWGSIEVDEIHASIYLTYSPSCIPLAINAIGGGAYEFYNIKRNTSTSKVRGKPRGFGYDALFGFEYALGGCNFHFIPLANAQYIYLRADSFNEKGSAAIHVDSQRVKSLRSSVGFRLNYYNETNEDLIVIPEFYAEWQREYMNRRRDLGIAPIAGIGGTILLPGTGRNIWLGGVDLLFTYRQKFGFEVSYETEYNSLYHDHFFYLGANFRF